MINLQKHPPTLAHAIKELNSEAEFCVRNEDIDDIIWNDNTTPISKEDILAKQIELQAEYDALDYARKRKAEYPSIEECIHAILDDTLDELQVKRQTTKNKYPK
tara:strand:- start:622 stop:933 length:312 start_codon:yes stop_codon:yes gene_type:complete